MDTRIIRDNVMDGVVHLVDMDDCRSAVARWRDLMEILHICSDRCVDANRKVDNGLCALCLERKLCEEARQENLQTYEAIKFRRAAEGLRAWIGRLGLHREPANK